MTTSVAESNSSVHVHSKWGMIASCASPSHKVEQDDEYKSEQPQSARSLATFSTTASSIVPTSPVSSPSTKKSSRRLALREATATIARKTIFRCRHKSNDKPVCHSSKSDVRTTRNSPNRAAKSKDRSLDRTRSLNVGRSEPHPFKDRVRDARRDAASVTSNDVSIRSRRRLFLKETLSQYSVESPIQWGVDLGASLSTLSPITQASPSRNGRSLHDSTPSLIIAAPPFTCCEGDDDDDGIDSDIEVESVVHASVPSPSPPSDATQQSNATEFTKHKHKRDGESENKDTKQAEDHNQEAQSKKKAKKVKTKDGNKLKKNKKNSKKSKKALLADASYASSEASRTAKPTKSSKKDKNKNKNKVSSKMKLKTKGKSKTKKSKRKKPTSEASETSRRSQTLLAAPTPRGVEELHQQSRNPHGDGEQRRRQPESPLASPRTTVSRKPSSSTSSRSSSSMQSASRRSISSTPLSPKQKREVSQRQLHQLKAINRTKRIQLLRQSSAVLCQQKQKQQQYRFMVMHLAVKEALLHSSAMDFQRMTRELISSAARKHKRQEAATCLQIWWLSKRRGRAV